MAKAYKSARKASADPMAWFKETMLYFVRKDAPASTAAAELGVWCYALLSWRKKPYVLPGEKGFTYHNAGGYISVLLGLALAFPVEIVGVHLLTSQWSVVAEPIEDGDIGAGQRSSSPISNPIALSSMGSVLIQGA